MIHGRDHAPGGADPIPGLASETELRVFSLAGALSVADGVFRWWPRKAGELTAIQFGVTTSPTGAGFTGRIRKNGTSVGTVTIAAGNNVAEFVPSTTTFSPGDYWTVDVTVVNGAAYLEVQFWGAYS